jgi:hypothetical protein
MMSFGQGKAGCPALLVLQATDYRWIDKESRPQFGENLPPIPKLALSASDKAILKEAAMRSDGIRYGSTATGLQSSSNMYFVEVLRSILS